MALIAYWIAHATSGWVSTPTGAQIRAGNQSNNSAASYSGTESGFATSGTIQIDEAAAITGLSAGTSYTTAWTVWDDVLDIYATPVVGTVTTDAGTTPVSSDLSMSWTLRSGVQATQSLVYPVKNATQQSRALDWAVKNAAQQSRTLDWAVKNAAQQSRALDWTLRAGVQQSRALSWSLLNGVQSNRSLSYTLRNGVQSGLPITYTVSASIQRQLDLAWSVLNGSGTPVLSDATVFNITGTTARLRVTITF